MKRIMPQLRSKSDSSTCVSGRRAMRRADVQRDGRRPDARLGRKKRENLAGRVERRRLALDQRLHHGQRFHDGRPLEWLRQKIANAGPHRFPAGAATSTAENRDHLDPLGLRFQEFDHLLRLLQRLETREKPPPGHGREAPHQIDRVRITVQSPPYRHSPRSAVTADSRRAASSWSGQMTMLRSTIVDSFLSLKVLSESGNALEPQLFAAFSFTSISGSP